MFTEYVWKMKRNKKILFVTMNYYPSNIPDAKRITGFAELLVERGYDVTVICSLDSTNEKKIEILNGVEVIRKKTLGVDSEGMLKRLVKHSSFMIQSVSHFMFKKDSFDFVFATSPALFNVISGEILSKKFESKYIVDLRDIWPEVFVQTKVLEQKSFIYHIFSRISTRSYKKANIITAVTPGKVSYLKKMFPDYESKIKYLSNGFNQKLLNYDNNTDIMDLMSEGEIKVVYCGKIGLAQNLIDFVNLSKHIEKNKVSFYILGSGNQLDNLLFYVKEQGMSNVHYLGNRNEEEVVTALRMADFSYVSLSGPELSDSVPTKLYESLVLGCPVLLSAYGDSADLLKSTKFGLTSNPGDKEKLVENFLSMTNRIGEFQAIKDQTISSINSNYSRDVIVNQLVNILDGLS